MPPSFDPATLDRLRQVREIRIMTGPESKHTAHRTTIWVVVDDHDWVLIRSVRGTRARWYRETLANPDVSIRLDGREVPVRAVIANDPGRIEGASTGFRAKYGTGASVDSMLQDETLETTLELRAR